MLPRGRRQTGCSMIVRSVLILALLISGLIGPPAAGASTPANSLLRTTGATSAPAPAQTTPVDAMATATKPRAVVSASYVVLGSGKVRVTVTSNAKKVKLTYRTAKNTKRTATVRIRKGAGAKPLPKGSKRIYAQALATSKLRASTKIPVLPFAPPPPDTTPPPVPSGLLTTAGDRQVGLAWAAVPAADLKEYVAVSGPTGSGPWTPAYGSPTTATGLTVTGLANDTKVWFTVAARDTSGNTSAYAPAVSATPTAPPTPDTTPPGSVTGLTVTATTANSISLSWSNPTDADLAEVIVRRTTGATPPASPATGTPVSLAGPKATSVTDPGLTAKTLYAYAVFTRDTTGNFSGPSSVSARTSVAAPTPLSTSVSTQRGTEADVALTDVSQLSGLSVESSPGGVTWSLPEGGLRVAVAMTAATGSAGATLAATGCLLDVCDVDLRIEVEVTIRGLEADPNEAVSRHVEPSPDRIADAQALTGSLAVLRDEVTIVLANRASAARATADAIAADVGAVVSGGDESLGVYQLRWNTAQDIQARLDQLVADARVASAEGGLLLQVTTDTVPYDGEDRYESAPDRWHLDAINAPAAWSTGLTGEGVTIGILENYHVATHEDLPPVGRGTQPYAPDDHPTHVAGLACAQDNETGVIGVAFGCTLLSRRLKYQDSTVPVYLPSANEQLKELFKAGAKVINNSWGETSDCLPFATVYEGKS